MALLKRQVRLMWKSTKLAVRLAAEESAQLVGNASAAAAEERSALLRGIDRRIDALETELGASGAGGGGAVAEDESRGEPPDLTPLDSGEAAELDAPLQHETKAPSSGREQDTPSGGETSGGDVSMDVRRSVSVGPLGEAEDHAGQARQDERQSRRNRGSGWNRVRNMAWGLRREA